MIEPYYKDEWVTLYCGDCREILPQLEVKADLCLTDPPYGLKDIMRGGGWAQNMKYITDGAVWDSVPIPDETLSMIASYSVLRIIWGGNFFTLPPSRCWLVWNKRGMGFSMAESELAWTNLDMPVKRFDYQTIYQSPLHPTQKPLMLMRWCLQEICPQATTILDPFAGSGTTLVAAKMLKRKSIGIEISQKYCDIIVNRLNKPIPLFDKPEQLSLDVDNR